MTVIDQKGRLFGKVSVIDLGAVIVVVAAVLALLFLPGRRATAPVVGGGSSIPIEVDMIVRGLSAPSITPFKPGVKANLIIRNQPYGEVDVVKVVEIPRTTPMIFPDGTVKEVPDPEPYRVDMVMTLAGNAQKTDTGLVLGNNPVKIGTTLEIDTPDYNMKGSIVELRSKS